MSKSFLLLSSIVLILEACGVGSTSSSSDAESSCETSACIKPPHFQPKLALATAKPDTGSSGPNLAEKLWNLQQAAEGFPTDLSSSFGKAAPAWVQAATLAAGASQVVTHGTVTQQNNGAFSYSNAPADQLVVHPSSGDAFSLENITTTGDFLSATFPTCISCTFSAKWVDANASLAMTLDNNGKSQWNGWVLAADNVTKITIAATSSFMTFVSDLSNYVSSDGDASGTVQFGEDTISLHYTDSSSEDGEVFTVTYADDATLTVAEGAVTLSSHRGTSMQNGQKTLTWYGTVQQSDTTVGQLEAHVEGQTSSGELVDQLVHVNSDVFNAGQLFVAGIASP